MTQGASGKSIAALVIGVVALAICCFPLGILAVVLGTSEMADIARGTSSSEGEGYAKAGIVLGWISFCVSLLGALAFLFLLLLHSA